MKLKKEYTLARKALKPLIEHCAKHRGARSELQRLMERKMGRTVPWAQLDCWVAAKLAKWKNPSFATGMALLDCQRVMCGPKMEATDAEQRRDEP